MSNPKLKDEVLPRSEAERLDRRIGEHVRRVSKGSPMPNDFSEISELIKRRADLLMPNTLRGRAPRRDNRG